MMFASNPSHPAGVRGLKHQPVIPSCHGLQSHPAGVRGLKLKHVTFYNSMYYRVAPRRGAWIETS